MSEAARIILVGTIGPSKIEVLEHIARIRTWDNGNNYPITIEHTDGRSFHGISIDDVEKLVQEDKVEEFWRNVTYPTLTTFDWKRVPDKPKVYRGPKFTPKKRKRK